VMETERHLEQVIANELLLLSPEIRASPEAVRALLHEQFREFGASGTIWDREPIVAALSDDGEPMTATEMRAALLASDVAHVTYRAHRGGRTTLRSSVWLRAEDGWKLYFHQGTPREAL
jgi:hypothetical protein